MKKLSLILLAMITTASLCAASAMAADPYLVKDIKPGVDSYSDPLSSNPSYLTVFNGALYFSAEDNTNGNELWKTDGTAAGTVIVKDINPGVASSSTPRSSNPSDLTVFNGALYFWASDYIQDKQLWKTDGTAAGTLRVTKINSAFYLSGLTVFNNALYFAAWDGNYDGLWKTDGTDAGVVMVKALRRTSDKSPSADKFTVFNGALFFKASNGTNSYELWKTDGTDTGTVMVKDIYPGSYGSYPDDFTVFNGALFFTAYNGTNGNELWKTDGTTAGTVMVKDICPGSDGSYPGHLTVVNGSLFFTAKSGIDGPGWELWKTDGTAVGTVIVKKHTSSTDRPNNLISFNSALYFEATYSSTEGTYLWKSDGTEAGTVMVTKLYPETAAVANGTLFLGVCGDLWKSDGTEAGTVKIKDISEPGSFVNYYTCYPRSFTLVNDILFFVADDVVHSSELWAFPLVTPGDINGGGVDLTDVILALRIVAGIPVTDTINLNADVNSDKKIGIEEVIYILQKVSGLRP